VFSERADAAARVWIGARGASRSRGATVGGSIQAWVSEPGLSGLAMSCAWDSNSTPIGRIAFDPVQDHYLFLVFAQAVPTASSWAVPNDSMLWGLPIVAQLFPLDLTMGVWRSANPSGVWLARP
jgi:hypothetical protein